jgi:hypothetical protein
MRTLGQTLPAAQSKEVWTELIHEHGISAGSSTIVVKGPNLATAQVVGFIVMSLLDYHRQRRRSRSKRLQWVGSGMS